MTDRTDKEKKLSPAQSRALTRLRADGGWCNCIDLKTNMRTMEALKKLGLVERNYTPSLDTSRPELSRTYRAKQTGEQTE